MHASDPKMDYFLGRRTLLIISAGGEGSFALFFILPLKQKSSQCQLPSSKDRRHRLISPLIVEQKFAVLFIFM
jgi:hypothetical protein